MKNKINGVITLNFKKSSRKNAKSISKKYYYSNDILLSVERLSDLVWNFISNKKYKYTTIELFKEPCILKSNIRYSIEQYINDLYIMIQLATDKKFDFTISDLYNNPNIKFLINEYYKKEV